MYNKKNYDYYITLFLFFQKIFQIQIFKNTIVIIIYNNFKNLTTCKIIMKEIMFSRWRRSMTMYCIKVEWLRKSISVKAVFLRLQRRLDRVVPVGCGLVGTILNCWTLRAWKRLNEIYWYVIENQRLNFLIYLSMFFI